MKNKKNLQIVPAFGLCGLHLRKQLKQQTRSTHPPLPRRQPQRVGGWGGVGWGESTEFIASIACSNEGHTDQKPRPPPELSQGLTKRQSLKVWRGGGAGSTDCDISDKLLRADEDRVVQNQDYFEDAISFDWMNCLINKKTKTTSAHKPKSPRPHVVDFGMP